MFGRSIIWAVFSLYIPIYILLWSYSVIMCIVKSATQINLDWIQLWKTSLWALLCKCMQTSTFYSNSEIKVCTNHTERYFLLSGMLAFFFFLTRGYIVKDVTVQHLQGRYLSSIKTLFAFNTISVTGTGHSPGCCKMSGMYEWLSVFNALVDRRKRKRSTSYQLVAEDYWNWFCEALWYLKTILHF